MDQPKNKPSPQGLGAKPQDPSLFNVVGGIKQIKKDPTAAAQSFGASVAEETLPTAAGWVGMVPGAELGATAGSIFGPVGTAVGGIIGGAIGFSIPSIIAKVTQNAVLKKFVPDTFKKLEETKLKNPYAAKLGGVVPLFGTGGVATFSKNAAIKAASRILPGEALKKMTEEQIVSQGRNILAKSMAARAGVGVGISGVGTAYDVATGKPVTPKEALSQAGESAGVLALTGEPTRLGRAITSTTNSVLNKAFIPFADRYINRSWELELHRTAVNNASNAIKQVEQQQASIIKQGTPTQEGIQSYRALEEAKNQLKLRLRTTQSMAYRSYEEMNVLQRKLSDAGFDLPNYYSQLSEAQKKGTLAKVINDYRNKWKLQPETIIGEPLKPSEPAVTPKGTLGITEQPVKEWKDILSEFKTDLGKDLGASTYTGSLLGGGEWKSLAKLISNSNLKIKDQIKEYRNTLSREGEDSSFLSDEQIGEVLETAKNEPLEPTFELVGEGRKKRIPNQSEFYEQNKYYLENLVKSKGITLLSNAPTVSKPTTFTGERRTIGARSEDLKDLISSEYEKAKENFAKPKGPQTLKSMLNQADLMEAKPARPEPPKTVEEQRALEAEQAGYIDEVSPEKKEIKEKPEGLLKQLEAAQTKNEVKKNHPKTFNESSAFKDAVNWLQKKGQFDYDTVDEFNKEFLEYVENRYRVELSALVGKGSEFGQKLPSSSIEKMVKGIAETAKETIKYRGLSSIEPAIEQKPSEFKIDWEGTRKDEAKRLAEERAETRGAEMFPRVTSGIKGRPELEPIYQAQREAQQKWVAELKRKKLERIARPVVTERLQTQKMEETKSGEAQVSRLNVDKEIRKMTDEELNDAIGLLKNKPSARISPLRKYAEIVNAGTPRARAVIRPQIPTTKGKVKKLSPIKEIDMESKILKAKLADLKKAEAKATKIAITRAKNLVALIRSYVDKGMTNAEIKEMYAGQIRAKVIDAIIRDPKKYINQIKLGEPVTTQKSVKKVKVTEDKLEAIKAEQVKQKPLVPEVPAKTPAVETKKALKAPAAKKPKPPEIIKEPVKKEPIKPVKPSVAQKPTKAAKVAEPPLKAKIDAIKKEQVRQSKKKPTEVAPSAVEPTDIEPISGPLPSSSPKAIKQKKDVNKVADKALKTTKVVEPIEPTIKPTKVKKTKPILPEKVIKKVVKKVNKISNQADIDRIKSNNSPEKNNEKIAKINAAKRKKSNSLQIKTNKLIKDQDDKLFEIEKKTNPVIMDALNAVAKWRKSLKKSGKPPKDIYSNLDTTYVDFENLVDVPDEVKRNLERTRFGKDTNDTIGLAEKALQKVYSMIEGLGNAVAHPTFTFVNIYDAFRSSGMVNWKIVDAAGRTIPNSASQAVTEFLTTGIGEFDPNTMTFKQTLETPFTRVLLEGLEKFGKTNEDNYVVFVNLYKEWQLRMQEIEEEMLLVEQMKEVQEEVKKLNEHAKTLTDENKKNALIKKGNDKLKEIVFPVRLGRKTPPGAVKQFKFRFTANQVSDDPKVGIPSVFQMGEKILGIPADEIKRIFDSANESERKQNIEVLKFGRESGVISNDLAKIFMEKVYYNPFTIIHENLLGDGDGITAYIDGLFSRGGSYVDQDTKEVLALKRGAEEFDERDLLGRGDDALYAKIANWKSIIDMSRINLYRSLGVREASLTPTSRLDYMILQKVGVKQDVLEAAKFLAFPTTNTDKTQSTLVYVNGKRTYWGLANTRLLKAFNTKLVTPDSRILNAAKSAKNLFTMSITVFPGFRISASLQERFAAAAMLGEANVKGALPKHTKGVIKNVISGFFAPNKLSEEQLKKLSDAMINGGVFGNVGDIFRQTSDRSSFFKKNEAAEEKLLRADVKRILERNVYLQDIMMNRVNPARAMTKQIWNGLTNLEHSGRIQDIALIKQKEDFIIEQEKLALEKNLIVNELEKLRSELSLQNETIKENYESLKGASKVDRKTINESIDVSKNAAKELKKLITDLEIKLSIVNPRIYGNNIFAYSEGRVLSADFSQLTGSKFLNAIRSTIPFVGTVTTGLFNFLSRVFRSIKPEFMRKRKEQERVNLFEERMEDLNKNIKNLKTEVKSKESLVSNLDAQVKNTKEKMKKIEGEIRGRLKEIEKIDKLMTKGNKVGRKFIPVSKAQRRSLADRRLELVKQIGDLDASFKELEKSVAREISGSLVNELSKANSDYKQSLRKLESIENFKEDFQQQEESSKKYFEYEKAIKNNIGKYLYWFLASHITVNYLTDLLYELAGDEAKLRYDNYYEYQKYHYIYIPGTKSDYKIPGGFVLQPFARWFVNSTYTIADDLWAKIDKDHVIDSASRKNLVAELVHALFSTNEGDGVTFAITFAQAAEEAFELLRNSGMAKSPNTGQYYIPEHLRGIKPSLQYDSTTGALFKFFATSLAKIGIEQSPMGWEKFYRDFTNKFYAGVLHPLNTIIADVPHITAPYAESGRIEAALNETADKLITYAFVSKHSVEENRYFGKVVGQYNDDRDKVNLLERNTLESLTKSGYQVSQDKKDYDIMARELANDEEAFKTILITNTNINYQQTLSSYNKWYINKRNDILLYYPQDTREQGLEKAKKLAKLDAFIGKKKLELVQNYKERKNLLLNPNFSSKFTKNDKIEIADIYLQYVVARGLRKEIGVKQ